MSNIPFIFEAIKTRRSVYPEVYTEAPISKEELQGLLELANLAPTHRLTEPWRFKVLAGESKSAFGALLAEAYKNSTSPESFKESKYLKKQKRADKSQYMIAICMQRDAEARLPEWEEIAATAMAVQNIWIAASASGIGMYWSSPSSIDSKEVRAFLKLQEAERCLGYIYMGRMPEGLQLEAKRTPIEAKIEWI